MQTKIDIPDFGSESLRWWLTILFNVAMFACGNAQKVFTVYYPSQADAILYETKNKSEADILIYRVGFASQVNPSKGLWHDVKNRSESEWTIFWAKYRDQSLCVVYFVPYRSQATRNTCYIDNIGEK